VIKYGKNGVKEYYCDYSGCGLQCFPHNRDCVIRDGVSGKVIFCSHWCDTQSSLENLKNPYLRVMNKEIKENYSKLQRKKIQG